MSKNRERQEIREIRTDLVVPTQSALLDRPELIAQIDDRFKGWRGIQTIALVGIAGAGKTTLARLYASSQKLSGIWEINAATKEALNGSFEELAQALSKNEADQKILTGILSMKASTAREEKVVQYVKERLRIHPNWLLIYDNVEKFIDIQNHFPKDPGAWGQGRIILTTQDSNIENNKHVNNSIAVGELNAEQKLSLFIKIMSNGGSLPFTTSQREEAKKFLIEIPPFPLDVSVAAYYLKATNISYKNYLENMHKYNNDFTNVQERILKEAGDYTKTRYSIITLSLKHLIDKNSNFKVILLFISLLDPQNIPRDLLARCKDEIIVDEFIFHLKKYSFITNQTPISYALDSSFSIHRSTQAIILAYLAKTLKLEQNKDLIQSTAKILELYMSDATNKEDFARMKLLYRDGEQLLSHDNLLNDVVRGSISGELGCINYYLCSYSKARELLALGISKLNQYPNKNHDKIAHFLVYLGNVYRRLGDYTKAKELFEQSLEVYKEHSAHHIGLARACGYLGIAYESLGDFEKAKTLLERSLLIHKKDTKNRIGLAWSLAHLGSVYKNLGNYERAKEFYEQSLTIYKSYSENHVGAAWVCCDLGSIYAKLGDNKRAKDLLEKSLIIYRRHFFENHVYIAKALVHLGVFYREAKKFEKAKSLLKKGLVVIEVTYGKDHIETGSILNDLGKTYFAEGNLEAAEDITNKAFNIFHKNNHHNKYIALEILADIYDKKSINTLNIGGIQQIKHLKMRESSYLKQALKVVKNHFPEDSTHIARIQFKLKKVEGR